MTSYAKRLHNEMVMLEEKSQKLVRCNQYYIIKLVGQKDVSIPNLEDIAKDSLSRNSSHQPLVTYVYKDTLLLLFSCLSEEESHYLNGNHHRLCSEYCYVMMDQFPGTRFECSVTEFDTQTQVYTYMSWLVYTTTISNMIAVSDNSISYKDTMHYTISELIERLKEHAIVWEDIPNRDRFGCFFKLKRRKNKICISTLSELMDGADNKKYITYLFGG